ncbi:MAG TPA: NAD-dependent malic enzyme [Candidatus Faecicola pullistercoris]|nr:NAD-dependent malic enzyme [Candidatus Faecicola pullistercoris]
MDYKEMAVELHRKLKGKIEVVSRVKVDSQQALSTAYTPGVAEPCLRIAAEPESIYDFTRKGNLVAVVTDGSAVLGLGNIGGAAGMPVMEGKAVLFKEFGDVDAFPICLATQDTEEIIRTVKAIAPTFGGINLEDISAPRCFEIEKRLIDELDIPVFHDDQHGTAIVVLAALKNALKVVGKDIGSVNAVILGPGAAGTAIANLLMTAGLKNLRICDRKGLLCEGREGMTEHKTELARKTNPEKLCGCLADVMKGADVFIGVSGPDTVTEDMIASMNEGAIVFAMSNPNPEIAPDAAARAGAAVIGTGRSDYPNQINNVLVFPGIFKGALSVRARKITVEMKLAAADAIASLISDEERSAQYIIPKPFDPRVSAAVAEAVRNAATK